MMGEDERPEWWAEFISPYGLNRSVECNLVFLFWEAPETQQRRRAFVPRHELTAMKYCQNTEAAKRIARRLCADACIEPDVVACLMVSFEGELSLRQALTRGPFFVNFSRFQSTT